MIYTYTLDAKGKDGVVGEKGTSSDATKKLSKLFTKFANKNDFGLMCELLNGYDVTLIKMKECLNKKGVIIARCYQDEEHYVLITKTDDMFAYIFDPYYVVEDHYYKDPQVAVVLNQIFTHNRIVEIKRLFSESKDDFSLMESEKREIILIYKQ